MKYEIICAKRKTMSLIVRDGKVLVRAPEGIDRSIIDDFVQSKSSWIEKHLKSYVPVGIDVASGESVFIFGKVYKIVFVLSYKFKWELKEDKLIIYSLNMTYDTINRRIENDLKKILDDYIKLKLEETLKLLGLKKVPYTIRKYKRLYGRCSRNGTLSFNTYLYHENYRFIDYVVLHECAHLIEFNHGKNFYQIIASIMPEYKKVMASKMNGQDLHPDQ